MEEKIQENQVEQPNLKQTPVAVEEKKVKPLTIVIPACRQAGCLIAILLIGAGGVYAGMQLGKKQVAGGLLTKVTPTSVLQPTVIPISDETANWKTYANTEYNYVLKYPSFLSFYKIIGEKSVLFKDMKNSTGLESNSFEINVTILDNPSSLDSKSFIDKIISDKNVSSGKKMISISEQPEVIKRIKRSVVIVDGINAEQVIGLPSYSGEVEVYIPRVKMMYKVSVQPYNLENPSEEQNKVIFDQILSTFKFLE